MSPTARTPQTRRIAVLLALTLSALAAGACAAAPTGPGGAAAPQEVTAHGGTSARGLKPTALRPTPKDPSVGRKLN